MLSACKLDASVLVSLDSIAWLLNIRASDVEFAPLAYAFGICWQDGEVDLFVDESKLSYAVLRHLGPGVRTFGYDEFYPTLENMPGRRIAVDRSEEHTSELQSLMRISYAVFCLTKKNNRNEREQ